MKNHNNSFDDDKYIDAEYTIQDVGGDENLLSNVPAVSSSNFKKKDSKTSAKKKLKKQKRKQKKYKRIKKELKLQEWYLESLHTSYSNVLTCRPPMIIDQSSERDGKKIPDYMLLVSHQDGGFFFGMREKVSTKHYVGKPMEHDGHIAVIGGPGSGKTSALVIPTLRTWSGVIIAVDVKGNLLKHWEQQNRHTGKRVKVFNPFQKDACGYDPFAFLRFGGDENLVSNAVALALSILPMPPETREPVWVKSSQAFLTAAILYYFDLGETFCETMTAIQLTSVYELITMIKESKNEVAKMYINKLKDVEPEIVSNIGLDITDLIVFATDPLIKSALCSESKCDVIDWNYLNDADAPYDIILQIPENKLEQWTPMTRLMLNQMVKALEQRTEKTYRADQDLPPILVMLDEFARLGKVNAIESGLATLRSRGVTFALFLQSISQLDHLYGTNGRKTIMDCCQYKSFLGISDAENEKNVSDLFGDITVETHSVSRNYIPATGEITYSQQIGESREPLIFPNTLHALTDILLQTPEGFCRVDKVPYFQKRMRLLAYDINSYTKDTR
ncbi:type IV secretory system conjugative DNA transfer family protein [Lachnospiraceae bacterium ZAX-1]